MPSEHLFSEPRLHHGVPCIFGISRWTSPPPTGGLRQHCREYPLYTPAEILKWAERWDLSPAPAITALAQFRAKTHPATF